VCVCDVKWNQDQVPYFCLKAKANKVQAKTNVVWFMYDIILAF